MFRPFGGWLSDKIGGIKMLTFLYTGVAIALAVVSTLPHLVLLMPILFIGMMFLGMGNGAVFQLVPQRFAREIGVLTGLVGAAGGLGGYFLPKILGNLKLSTGSYTPGFLILSGVALVGVTLVLLVQKQWKRSWAGEGGKASLEVSAAKA